MINHFPLAGSGSGTYTKNLAVHLAELGHEVSVILPENTLSIDPLPGVQLHPVYFTPEDGSPAPSGALPFNFPCFTTHPRSTMTFAELSEPALEMYKEAFRRAIAEEMREMVRQLPPQIRETVILKYFSGMSIEEIATTLGIPPGTVKSRLFTAKRILADELRKANQKGQGNE